jgi:hypothetical protein
VNNLDTLPRTYRVVLNGEVVAIRDNLQEALEDADAFLCEYPKVKEIEVKNNEGGTWIRINK